MDVTINNRRIMLRLIIVDVTINNHRIHDCQLYLTRLVLVLGGSYEGPGRGTGESNWTVEMVNQNK